MSRAIFTMSSKDNAVTEEVIAFIQEAIVSSEATSALILHNYLGILFHIQAFNSREPSGLNDVEQVKSSLEGLRNNMARIGKSIQHFEAALELAKGDAEKYFPKIKQNLELTRHLAGMEEKKIPWIPPLSVRWQFVYLDALRLESAKRLFRLLDAEKELARLPYHAVPTDRSTLAMIEQLYQEITAKLFEQEKYSEALLFSEKGKKTIVQALTPIYKFSSEERQEYFNEIKTYANQLSSLENEDAETLLDEYQEFMEMVDEDDPELVDWVSPNVPTVEVVQSLLRKDEIFLKLQRLGNDILVWQISHEKISAGRISGDKIFFNLVQRIAETNARITDIEELSEKLITPLRDAIGNAKSIILLAEGRLEFLPWAALNLNGKPLIENSRLTFVSSLSHFVRSVNSRSLYSSRL
ncbi:MAG TPA: hypothetical protein DE038_01680, partial [Nitrospina sp.]|nr:hypothetical protein [Nitrospina sp.]